MSKRIPVLSCVAALMGGATASQAAVPPSFDTQMATNAAERLALCDAASFLNSRPDLNANRILVRRDSGAFYDWLLPPDFLVGGRFYTETADRLYLKIRRRGEVDRNMIAEAQDRLVRPIIRAQGRMGRVPYRAWREQLRDCNEFARAEGVRGVF